MTKELPRNLCNCEVLANAIILQAVSDYVKAEYRLRTKKFTNDEECTEEYCKNTVDSCRRFFNSQLFELYTTISKDYILRVCDMVVEEFIKNKKTRKLNAGLLFDTITL